MIHFLSFAVYIVIFSRIIFFMIDVRSALSDINARRKNNIKQNLRSFLSFLSSNQSRIAAILFNDDRISDSLFSKLRIFNISTKNLHLIELSVNFAYASCKK